MRTTNDNSELYVVLFSLITFLLLYFLPTFLAFSRHHYRRWQILAGNLLLGWTFLFWCYCLIIAISPGAREDD